MISRTSKRCDRRAWRWIPGWARSPRAGFTLLELLLAVSILGLALGLGLPRVEAVREGFLRTEELRAVEGLLRAARASAIEHRATVTVAVAADDDRTLVRRRGPGVSWSGPSTTHSDRMVPPSRDAVVRRRRGRARLEIHAPDGVLRFHADGSSSGGEIRLRGDGGRPIGDIGVDPATAALVTRLEGERR